MTEPTLYVVTPSHLGDFPHEYVQSLIGTVLHYSGRIMATTVMGSFLPRSRDLCLSRFLKSPCDYLLSVDSDIGWTPEDVQKLIDCNVDLVSGCYVKKDSSNSVPVRLCKDETWSNERMLRAEGIPGGFFLMKREAAQRITDRYSPNIYITDAGEKTTCLHAPILENGVYFGEDMAFCRRWRDIGGDIWIRPDVRVKHVGKFVYGNV